MSIAESGRRGLSSLSGLIVGLGAGVAVCAIAIFWIGKSGERPLPLATLTAIVAGSAIYLVICERGAAVKSAAYATAIASALSVATFGVLTLGADPHLIAWPRLFWLGFGLPLAAFLMAALAKASIPNGLPAYSSVFLNGLTIPLVLIGAAFLTGLAAVFVYAAAWLLKSLNVDILHRVFQQAWFMLPFLGAAAGLFIAMVRNLESVLGALRFAILMCCRIAMPFAAIFSLTLLGILLIDGPAPLLATPSPATLALGAAFIGMLLFNGVYQTGQDQPPPAWLRLSALTTILTLPILAALAGSALWIRVEEFGLTPARIAGLMATALAALYSAILIIAAVAELRGGKRWMPLLAPMNTMIAVVWSVALLAMAVPLNPWALSARDQERRLAEERIDATRFDYGYLRFSLGRYGEAAFDHLGELSGHPQANLIQAGIARARAAPNRFVYDHGPPSEPMVEKKPERPAPPGLADLPLFPDEAPPDIAEDQSES